MFLTHKHLTQIILLFQTLSVFQWPRSKHCTYLELIIISLNERKKPRRGAGLKLFHPPSRVYLLPLAIARTRWRWWLRLAIKNARSEPFFSVDDGPDAFLRFFSLPRRVNGTRVSLSFRLSSSLSALCRSRASPFPLHPPPKKISSSSSILQRCFNRHRHRAASTPPMTTLLRWTPSSSSRVLYPPHNPGIYLLRFALGPTAPSNTGPSTSREENAQVDRINIPGSFLGACSHLVPPRFSQLPWLRRHDRLQLREC